MAISRRQFIAFSSAGLAAGGLPMFHLQAQAVLPASQSRPLVNSWEDLYRQRWTWDSVAKGSHGWVNCRSACNWDIYVKNGVVVREEQAATYEASEPGVPDFNPRGCQKGACYTDVMYGPSRLTVPMKRVGERGSRQWQKISWDQAIGEIAEKFVDIAEKYGPEAVYHDLGPHFDQGSTTAGRVKFFTQFGGTIADDWAEIGDLNHGAMMTFGFPHMGGTSDEWFLSDHLVVWMMNPSVTQIPDAHFLFEAKYNGAKLTVIDPQYTATAVHADSWLPIKTGTDAILALAVARYIWESGHMDKEYVLEQTDLPFLVRLDTGRFLREEDVIRGGKKAEFYCWNEATKSIQLMPAGLESETPRLLLEGIQPALEGQFSVTLADGKHVQCATVASILKEQLDQWTLARAAQETGLHLAQVEAFAKRFAEAKRPMILSSWGSNRFFHSDLMNRAKILCLSLKGAIGKRGSGLSATGWFAIEGFEASAEMTKKGWAGLINLYAHTLSADDIFHLALDLVTRRKTQLEISADLAYRASVESICATNSATVNLNHQGIKEILDDAQQKTTDYPRKLSEYDQEAREKGWMPLYPAKTTPKAWVTGGNNVLRRSNMPQKMLEHLWPQMDVIVDINPKITFTGMNADYLLPAAGYYEKPAIKYPVAYVPYLHFCDAAIPPIGESKDEWEIFWLLAQKVQEIAKQRNTPVLEACGLKPVDLKQIHDKYSSNGAWTEKDAFGVTQEILDFSTSTVDMTIDSLKKTGVQKYTSTGATLLQSQLYNEDWKGEGVLTPAIHQVTHKWRWPTLTGRQQFYIDHPWFIEARETLPTHKASPKSGGDYPFQMVSCHSRWSIHSVWRDTPLLMRLQRGEPLLYLNPADAAKLNIEDHAWAEIFNDLGKVRMRIKHSNMVRPGVAYYFHAWEPHQFPNHQSYKWITPGLMKPMHFAGGDGHLGWRFAMFEPGTHVQDTRIGIRPWTHQSA